MKEKQQHRRRVMRMRKGKDGDEQQTGREEKKMHMGGYSIGNSSPKGASEAI